MKRETVFGRSRDEIMRDLRARYGENFYILSVCREEREGTLGFALVVALTEDFLSNKA